MIQKTCENDMTFEVNERERERERGRERELSETIEITEIFVVVVKIEENI